MRAKLLLLSAVALASVGAWSWYSQSHPVSEHGYQVTEKQLEFDAKRWDAATSDDYSVRKSMAKSAARLVEGKTEKEVREMLGEPDYTGYATQGWIAQGKNGTSLWNYRLWTPVDRNVWQELRIEFKHGRAASAELATEAR